MIREIFQRCGEIQTIRMSKKNFCHVRFLFENSVEAAFYFSGCVLYFPLMFPVKFPL